MRRRARVTSSAAAALVITMATAVRAQPPPPRFEPPVFAVAPPEETPQERASGADDEPPRLLVQVDAGARYRRMYSADITAFQLLFALGKRVRPYFHPSGFVLAAIGATNQGLQTRFLTVGGEFAFPLAAHTDGFFRRLRPAIRVRANYMDVARITRPDLIWGFGLGADAQLGVDLFQEGAHAIYAAGRFGLEGYLTQGEGFSLFSGIGMWGGELAVGFRY
jgi:hypothetical protein